MTKKLLLGTLFCGLSELVAADTAITLDQQQLGNAQQTVQISGNKAIANMQQSSQALSTIKLKNLNLKPVESEIEYAQPVFKNTKPLSTKLPNGQKYYLYSESVVSDSKAFLAQYKDGKPLDINQTITDYNQLNKNAKNKIGNNRLLVFISSSMPKKTIINLMTQAAPLGAVFVIRGLINGSYVNTYKYFYALKGDNEIGIMINPTLFKALDVDVVPTYALYQSDQDLLSTACNVAPKYTKVSGEVTVHYALEQLSHSTNQDLAQIAKNELDVLDNSGTFKNRSTK
jgi:type-F conjugative transfer system pilin assembly protein TrbC